MHTLIDPNFDSPRFVFELPRFDLSFELRADSRLHSRNYRGFFMAGCQQLSDVMYNFEQYLVLEDDQDSIKVIVPIGTVTKSSHFIVINGPLTSDANRSHHAYDCSP